MPHAFDTADTIVALATARSGSMRGVVRVSGDGALACVERIWRSTDDKRFPRSGHAVVCDGEVLASKLVGYVPCAAYIWPTRRSYTRQPSLELHTIGAVPILDAIVQAICANGARLAEPGEFTMRAFLAGRMDLTQAEAVLGVIDANSQHELDVALRQLAGGLS